MKDQETQNNYDQIESQDENARNSAKTVIRLLQGLGAGIVLYLFLPILLLTLLGKASGKLSYMNIICPDDDIIFFNPSEREIFINQRQNRKDKIEVISTSEDSITIKISSEDNPEVFREEEFKVESTANIPESGASEGFTLKIAQLEIDCIPSNQYDESAILLILAFISGSTGSVVSILSRVSDYHGDEYGNTSLPFYIGLFKPVIGGAFGVFIFSILASGLIQISNPLNPTSDEFGHSVSIEKWLFFIGISFVGGFSERLAKDIIGVTEDRFGSEPDEEK